MRKRQIFQENLFLENMALLEGPFSSKMALNPKHKLDKWTKM